MENVVVLGGGESGVGAALLARKKGMNVWLSDKGVIKDKYKTVLSNHEIPFEENGHTEAKVLAADVVVKSPGIPEKVEIIQKLFAKNIPVISEIEFAGRFTNARFIGITGSNGKTTTTMLTYHILKRAGINVGLAGNVGKSLAASIAEGDQFDWYVLELSSFQLDGMIDFKCDIAILLNITEDHLDRYGYDVMNYARSKMRITQNLDQDCHFIYNLDDPITKTVMEHFETAAKLHPISIEQNQSEGLAAFANNNELIINPNNNAITMTIQELALQGKHNLYNSMASAVAARILEIRKDLVRECLSDFQNIEHRLEHVNNVHGMTFINDSKATNVNSAWYALESMSEPIIWIAGGVDKGNDYSQLSDMVKQKVKAIVCLGKDNARLKEAFAEDVEQMVETDNMVDAVRAAYKMGKKDYTILLSPACASFDLFQDYEDRGRQFKEAVRNL